MSTFEVLDIDKFNSLSSEERTAYIAQVAEAQKKQAQGEKRQPGRPRLEADKKRMPCSVTITDRERESLQRFGKGQISRGIARAVAFIEKYNLYEREDC